MSDDIKLRIYRRVKHSKGHTVPIKKVVDTIFKGNRAKFEQYIANRDLPLITIDDKNDTICLAEIVDRNLQNAKCIADESEGGANHYWMLINLEWKVVVTLNIIIIVTSTLAASSALEILKFLPIDIGGVLAAIAAFFTAVQTALSRYYFNTKKLHEAKNQYELISSQANQYHSKSIVIHTDDPDKFINQYDNILENYEEVKNEHRTRKPLKLPPC
ncbi:MAG: hypothetical protein ACXAC8_13720 [Candidatus Hodarchaeales archaeon]|jgi:hypothetical protein